MKINTEEIKSMIFWLLVAAVFQINYQLYKAEMKIKRIEANPAPAVAYVYICKRIPPQGQENWVEWLQENGECSLAVARGLER